MNITVRHSEPADLAAIKHIYAQAACYAGTLQLPFPPDALWEQRLVSHSDNFYSLVALADGEVAGQLGMEVYKNPRRRHVANLGMAVSTAFQQRGVGTALLEAALMLAEKWLAITRIELEVYVDNAAGIALYRRAGFEIEGTAKGYAFRDGQCVDVHYMARVKQG